MTEKRAEQVFNIVAASHDLRKTGIVRPLFLTKRIEIRTGGNCVNRAITIHCITLGRNVPIRYCPKIGQTLCPRSRFAVKLVVRSELHALFDFLRSGSGNEAGLAMKA